MSEERPGAPPRIALIADTMLQRLVLQQTLLANGFQVVLSSDPADFDEAALVACEADLWLVDVVQIGGWPTLDGLLERLEVPLLYGEGTAPPLDDSRYLPWERRLLGKLKKILADPDAALDASLTQLMEDAPRPARLDLPAALGALPLQVGANAERVWLLAGGLGAPAAVRAFLDALPGGLPLGFIYAQHHDPLQSGPAFETYLAAAVGRYSQWQVGSARSGDTLRCGEVVIAPVERELNLGADGLMHVSERGWPLPYTPSIEQLMLELAGHFGRRFGVIVFSGLGSDGRAACGYVQRQQGTIWTQRGDTCEAAFLPEQFGEGAPNSFSGDPRELAEALVQHLVEQLTEESPR